MPVSLSQSFIDRFLGELNTDELKVYMHLGSQAQARAWASIPDPPRFSGRKSDSFDPAADLKRFKAALGGLKLKDLVELDGEGKFRLPYLSPSGVHEAERQIPSPKERMEIWQELQRELYGVIRLGPSRRSFLALLEALTRYVPRLPEGIAELHKDGAERSGDFFEEIFAADQARARGEAAASLAEVGPLDLATAPAVVEKIVSERALPADVVWREAAARITPPVPAGPAPLTAEELAGAWADFVAHAFPPYVARHSRVNFLRLLQVAFLFATHRLPEGDPEELFAELRELTASRYQELMDRYQEKARDVVLADAARSVPDEDLLAGKTWEHAKRLSAKHEVPVEVVMDLLASRHDEVLRRSLSGEFSLETFEPPDISGLGKEEGELAWIDAVAVTEQQRDSFRFVLRRLRRAKRGYLHRAIVAYCYSILDLLDEHGMIDHPTDEIIDNIVATINEQTAYFREQYFALTVDPVEAGDVREVLRELAERRAKQAR